MAALLLPLISMAITGTLIEIQPASTADCPEDVCEAPRQAPEGTGRSEVTESGRQPDKMFEVAGLAAAIADRILAQHEASTSIPPEQFRMLVRAARMLLDNDMPWPQSVEHVVIEVAKRVGELEHTSLDDDLVVQLTRP